MDDGAWGCAALCVAVVLAVLAAPPAGWERFGWLAAGLGVLLLLLGLVTALAGGFLMWPAGFAFLVAAVRVVDEGLFP